MLRLKIYGLFLLPFLTACSDERAAFQIDGSNHALTLIRQQNFFWEKRAEYTLVAARMPDCMRRHKLGTAALNSQVEVFSPGNNAWIIRQGKRVFVVETRTCEGFADLKEMPEGGYGAPAGVFQLERGKMVFVAAPAAAPASAAR